MLHYLCTKMFTGESQKGGFFFFLGQHLIFGEKLDTLIQFLVMSMFMKNYWYFPSFQDVWELRLQHHKKKKSNLLYVLSTNQSFLF